MPRQQPARCTQVYDLRGQPAVKVVTERDHVTFQVIGQLQPVPAKELAPLIALLIDVARGPLTTLLDQHGYGPINTDMLFLADVMRRITDTVPTEETSPDHCKRYDDFAFSSYDHRLPAAEHAD